MNLSQKLVILATLIDKLTDAGVRAEVATAFETIAQVSIIVSGDQAQMMVVGAIVDKTSGVEKVGDINAPSLRLFGTFDGLEVVVTTLPQKESS